METPPSHRLRPPLGNKSPPDPNQGSQEWLPIEETARLLKRSHWGIRWMLRNNRIEAIRTNRRLMFSVREILRLIQEGKTAK